MNHQFAQRCFTELVVLFDSLSLPFFLLQGTALGAYRDKGFTPTEKDIDFGVLYENFAPSCPTLIEELVRLRYDVTTISKPFTRCRTIVAAKTKDPQSPKPDCKVDIVSLAPWKSLRFNTRPLDHRNLPPYSIVHNARLVENTQTLKMFGLDVEVPSPVEVYLEREYGEDWKTPREDHVSQTRIYHFIRDNGIPYDYLESF